MAAGFLVTGARSGFGRHAHEVFGGATWVRDTSPEERRSLRDSGADVIVHSAFNAAPRVDSENAAQYLRDNVLLTAELLRIPCRKFVFVSTVDVYPKDAEARHEDDVIDLSAGQKVYGVTKLLSEALVREQNPDHLILRCSALLGRHMRRNSLVRMIEDEPCRLGLAEDSRFNYVLHRDVTDFITLALERDLRGVFNVASDGNVRLSEVAAYLGKHVEFGSHWYDVGEIDNGKASGLAKGLRRSSLETVQYFIADRRGTVN